MVYTLRMTNELQKFIAHARSKGMDHATIRMLLLSAGWKERDVAQALSAEGLDMPVPVPSDAGGARDAFFHLLNFAALYTTVISSLILLFTFINRLYPDAAIGFDYASSDLSGIRWSMAAIIVAFPLFTWISRMLITEMNMHVEKAGSGVRRWLTYLTLFVAATTMMGDVITLVYQLLQGELSVRFLLKVFVILLVAGMAFTYYFLSLRLSVDVLRKRNVHRNFFFAALTLAAVVLVWGAMIVGSPVTERARQFDGRRIEDLQAISSEIDNIVYEGYVRPVAPNGETLPPKHEIPQTLEKMKLNAMYTIPNTVDPETGAPYEYILHGTKSYELCATFSHERQEKYSIFWNHPAGRTCFAFDVTKQLAK